MKPTLRNAVKWAFVLNWGQRGITTLITFVLAAMLGPEVFGVVAMALIYLSFIQIFLEQGFSAAVIQRKELESRHLDAVFWLTVAASLLLMGLSIALSHWWAVVNSLPALEPVINVLALMLPIRGLTIVQQAVLTRRLDFKSLAIRGNIGAIIGGATGLAMAATGFGVWAIVAQQLTGAFAALVLLWVISDWRPGFRSVSVRHLRDLIGFSSGVLVGQIGVFINRRSDPLLMGIFFGPIAVGLYRLAERLVETSIDLATRPISATSLSYLSKRQDDPPAFVAGMDKVVRMSSLTAAPVLALLATVAEPLIELLGAEWAPAVRVLQILCLFGFAKAMTLSTSDALMAAGRPHLNAALLWANGIIGTAVFVGVALWLRNAPVEQQVIGMAAARTIVALVVLLPFRLLAMSHATPYSIARFVRKGAPGVTAGISAGVAATAALLIFQPAGLHAIAELAIAGAVGTLSGMGTALALDPCVRSEFIALMRHVLPRRSEADSHLDLEQETASPPLRP